MKKPIRTTVPHRGYVRKADGTYGRPAVDFSIFGIAKDLLDDLKGVTEDDFWELAREFQIAFEDVAREVEERAKGAEK
jgi:hypothetical protein